MEKTKHTAFSDWRLWTQAVALGCREQAGRWDPRRSGPECYSISPDLCSPKRLDPKAALTLFLSFAGSQDPLLPPPSLSAPSLAPRAPEACGSAGKVKGCNSGSLSEQPVGQTLVRLGPLAHCAAFAHPQPGGQVPVTPDDRVSL